MVEFNPEKHVRTPEKPCVKCGGDIRYINIKKGRKYGACVFCGKTKDLKRQIKRLEESKRHEIEMYEDFKKNGIVSFNPRFHIKKRPCKKCGCNFTYKNKPQCPECKKRWEKSLSGDKLKKRKLTKYNTARKWAKNNPEEYRKRYKEYTHIYMEKKYGFALNGNEVDIITTEEFLSEFNSLNVSQKKFAKFLGISQAMISNICRGVMPPGIKVSFAFRQWQAAQKAKIDGGPDWS